ncbi:MAG: hypothetical protein ACOYL8_03470 [Patescibacteria group bacterium]
MKKIIVFFVLLISVLILSSCSKNVSEKKITGTVKSFQSKMVIDGYQVEHLYIRVEFTDGRYFFLDQMPASQIMVGSEVVIYFDERNASFLAIDSVKTLKKAPDSIKPFVKKDTLVAGTSKIFLSKTDTLQRPSVAH